MAISRCPSCKKTHPASFGANHRHSVSAIKKNKEELKRMSEPGCLFCRVVAEEIPADVVHRDGQCVVIRDINPQAPTHLLVIPHEHIESLDEASRKDEALLGHLLRIAARVANAAGLAEGGYRTVINNGAGAGQSVFHLHVHLLGGRTLNWPPG
jgi:histidine triad (HIT) family protein